MRRPYLYAHAFELMLAALAILSSLGFLLDEGARERSAVGVALHPYDLAWNLGYLAAGLLVVIGLAKPAPRVEASGLCLFSAAIAINLVAVVAVHGAARAVSIGVFAAVILACFARLRVLYGRRVTEVTLEPDGEAAG